MLEYLEKFNNLPNDVKQKISSGSALAQIEVLEEKYGVPLAAFIVRVMIGDLYYKNITANLIIEYDMDASRAEELEKILKEKVFAGVMDYLEGGKSAHPEAVSKAAPIAPVSKNVPAEEKKEESKTVSAGSVAEQLVAHHFKVETNAGSTAGMPATAAHKEQLPPAPIKNFLDEDKKDITATGKVIASFQPTPSEKSEMMLQEIVKEANISFASADLLRRFKEILLTYLRNVRTKVEVRENLVKDVFMGGVRMKEEDVDRVLAIAQKKLSAEENKFLSLPKKINARTTGEGTNFVFSDKDLEKELEEKARTNKIEEFKKAPVIGLGARDVEYDLAALSKRGPLAMPKKIEKVIPPVSGVVAAKKAAPLFPDIDLRKEPVKKINPISKLIKAIKDIFSPAKAGKKVVQKETKQMPGAKAEVQKKPGMGVAPAISVLPASSIVGIKPPTAVFPDIDLRKPVKPAVPAKKFNFAAKLKGLFSAFSLKMQPKEKIKTVFPDIELRKPVLPAAAAKPVVAGIPAQKAVPAAAPKGFFSKLFPQKVPAAKKPEISRLPVVSAPSAVSTVLAKPAAPALPKMGLGKEPVKPAEPMKPGLSMPAVKPAGVVAAKTVVPVPNVMEAKDQKRVAAVAGNKKRIEDIKPAPKVMSPVDELAYMDLVNFRRLDPIAAKRVAKIEEKINLLEKEGIDKKIEGIAAWRSNPVSKTYISMGQESIVDGKNIDDIIKDRKDHGLNYLSKEEFEAVLDLNNNLRF